jgi:hypothetical protein
MTTASLELHFSHDHTGWQLVFTRFSHPRLDSAAICTRGKNSSALRNAGCFQWTRAVQSLCLILLRYKLSNGQTDDYFVEYGYEGSYASSLDLAISRCPRWIGDMFGRSRRRTPFARQLFLRTNSELRLPGPVYIGVDSILLPSDSIQVFVKQRKLTLNEIGSLLYGIEGRLQSDSNLEQRKSA